MAEITLHLGGPTSDDCDIDIEWFDRNGVHATQHLVLTVDPSQDALVVSLDSRVMCVVHSNGKRVIA